MRKISKYQRRLQGALISVAGFVIALNIICMPSLTTYKSEGENFFHVYVNETDCGCIGSGTDVTDLLADARRTLGTESDSIVYVNPKLRLEGSTVVFGEIDSEEKVVANMVSALKNCTQTTKKPAMTLKIDDYSVNLNDSQAVLDVLQAALDIYQANRGFVATLVQDPTSELSSITANVITDEEARAIEDAEVVTEAGFDSYLDSAIDNTELADELKDFDDYVYGLESMSFGNDIVVVDAYLPSDQITDTETAIKNITVATEVDSEYEVQSGDTLSQIAEKVNIPMDRIIAMNDTLDDENSMIRAGDKLLITVPEPILSVVRHVREYVEEVYDADIEYVENDEWYTTDKVTLQQPSSGFRNIVADTEYRNDKQTDRTVVKQVVVLDAVPKIVERGTKIPPTYIKPISGGRITSTFGYRNRPKARGATAYHQGVDWGTPIGTTVYASCGGTVAQAGWMSGYGYCVFINHPDGRQTRYAHLSRCLVSKGQSVSQGQVIARSGNTGASTGPHLHFEIRIGGSPVNPLKYLN